VLRRLLAPLLGLLLVPATALAAHAPARETVGRGAERATIVRDRYGVPHISARALPGVWFGDGWAQAEDRLVQLELVRRNVEGRLAEVFGPSELSDDEANRRDFYTPAELRAEAGQLPRFRRRQIQQFDDGVNAYIAYSFAPVRRDAMVPKELWIAGALQGSSEPFRPGPWRPSDTVAIGNFLAREFGGGGGDELRNLDYLRHLEATLGQSAGRAVFDDTRWIDDPTAPTTVPARGANGRIRAAAASTGSADPIPWVPTSDVRAAAARLAADRSARARAGIELKVPWKDGSNAFVVAPWRTVDHHALLWGAPQEGFGSPSIDGEAYFSAPGYHAGGMYIPGEPYILIGQNRQIAWTTTSEELVDQQVYAEKADFSTNPPRYLYRGRMVPMRVIHESVPVLGQPAHELTIYRTVHGPVFQTDPAHGVAFAMRYASWKREAGTLEGFAEMGGDTNVAAYRSSVSRIVTLHNFFYADRRGNIAYWGTGLLPRLPTCRACDPRLPHSGTGGQEWRGFTSFAHMPHSVNPRQGYLVNWNTKPSARHFYQQNGGDEYWGTIYRSSDIARDIRTAGRRMTLAKALAVERDVGTIDGDDATRPAARYLLPFLFAAYDRLGHPGGGAVAEAIGRLRRWDDRTSLGVPAMTIYVEWEHELQLNLWGGGDHPGEAYTGAIDLAPDFFSEATYNATYHVLARPHGQVPCGVLCHRGDYFAGHRDQILVESLQDALARLSGTGLLLGNGDATGFHTADQARWGWRPWPDINWDELDPVALGVTSHLGRSPSQERSTYMQGLELGRRIRGVNVLPPGQSGFISKAGALDPHFGDQIGLFDRFAYKPMRLG
jgi:penicillin amidase